MSATSRPAQHVAMPAPTSPMPWIRLWLDFLDDPKIGALPVAEQLMAVKLMLLAGECDAGGALVSGSGPLSTANIAWRLRMDISDVETQMQNLLDCAFLCHKKSVWMVKNFAKWNPRPQSERRDAWRKRQAKHREIAKSVTRESRVSHALVTPLEREGEREKEIEGEKRESESSETLSHPRIVSVPPDATVTAPPPTFDPGSVPESLKSQPRPPTPARRAARTLEVYKHPAVLAYISVFRANPNEIQASNIVREVTDVSKWGAVCQQWASSGYRKESVDKMLTVYREGWRAKDWPTPNGSGNGRRGRTFRREQVPDSTPEHREEARQAAVARIAESAPGRDELLRRRAQNVEKLKMATTQAQREYVEAYIARIDEQLAKLSADQEPEGESG